MKTSGIGLAATTPVGLDGLPIGECTQDPERWTTAADEDAKSICRSCPRRWACAREAVATLTYDYEDQMAVIGPLARVRDPHAHDLCAIHTDRLSAPKGWIVVRHETLRA